MSEETTPGGSPGPSTDRHNDPVVDPTRNVRELVEAALRRTDDLRNAAVGRQDDLRELTSLHIRDLLAHETTCANKIADLRSEHDHELRNAEAERINAIRAVDVQAAQQGRLEGETRARALETQVAAAAEAMRNQVASAATAAATALANALDPIQKDIADLRRAQYEAQGVKAQTVEERGTAVTTTQLGLGLVAVLIAAAGIYFGTRNEPAVPVAPPITVTVERTAP